MVKTEEDIDLSEYDNWYSDKSRLYKLNFMQNKLTDKDLSKYSYVATISNGIDYYFGNNKYIAINNNFMLKEFDNNDLFLLDELKGKYKFEYLSENEAKKIADSITEKYKEGNLDKISKTNLENYLDYENDKELNSFSDKSVLLKLMLRISNENELKDKIKNSKAKLESRKNDEIEL